MWDGFFDPPHIIGELGMTAVEGDVVEFGCGYGTFTVAAARAILGTVYALDVERQMVEVTRTKVRASGLRNVRVLLRDFVADGTGLADESVCYAMVFNLLHCEHPQELLTEVRRVLAPGGSLGIIHWNHDSSTPRGPSMDIRPTPEQCRAWAESVGFVLARPGIIDLPPYHYGLRMEKAI